MANKRPAPTCSAPTNIDLGDAVAAKQRAQQSTRKTSQRGHPHRHHRRRRHKSSPDHQAAQAKDVQTGSAPAATCSYWHYKQTGVKSRPIKLLKHPIEHIERKILLTYLLGFLFKLIALISGPPLVFCAYLLAAPTYLCAKVRWFLLNLFWKSRICTAPTNSPDELSSANVMNDWQLCPLSSIEAYWFRERLVNSVLLTLDKGPAPKVSSLRSLVANNLLARPHFRKFVSRVEWRGLPLYKSLYWRHLELRPLEESSEVAEEVKEVDELIQAEALSETSLETNSSSSSSSSSFSGDNNGQVCLTVTADQQQQQQQPPTVDLQMRLEQHIFADKLPTDDSSQFAVCQYVHQLLEQPLNLQRPLWQLRVISPQDSSSSSNTRSYLVFRCHQSLADGRSLCEILTDHLTVSPPSRSAAATGNSESHKSSPFRPDNDDELKVGSVLEQLQLPSSATGADFYEADEDVSLRWLSSKKSFVQRMSSSSSWRSAVFVGPLTVLLWVIWTFTRRKNNHLNSRWCVESRRKCELSGSAERRRFHMSHYSLTRFWQIKQMTRSTVADVILCALSGAFRDYLRHFNAVSNPPNLNASLLVDMRQPISRIKKNNNQEESKGHKTAKSFQSQPPDSFQKSPPNESPPEVSSEAQTSRPQVNCTLVNVPLPVSVEGTVPRLWELRDTMDELRTSADPWVMLGLQRFLSATLPVQLYQRLVNYISLRNSSILVSSICGPHNMVEGWCVDLLQRTMLEAQQSRAYKTVGDNPFIKSAKDEEEISQKRNRRRENNLTRLRLNSQLGGSQLSSIHYCMQPPTKDIPISFNCITYHDKLFVTSLSRSLLVEDSQLLIKLFFRQLDHLANTIAKRRSLVTIIAARAPPPPIPIEISCQPPSPDYRESPMLLATADGEDSESVNQRSPVSYEHSHANPSSARSSPHLASSSRDVDVKLEMQLTDPCVRCKQVSCICPRRKSLFSFDQTKMTNLANILRPINFMSTSRTIMLSNERVDHSATSECICGQKLLEELDEDENNNSDGDREGSSSYGGAHSPNSDVHMKPVVSARSICAKCRVITQRSTLSLDTSRIGDPEEYREQRSSSSIDNKRQSSNPHNSVQLIVPKDSDLHTTQLSRSETDLLPKNRAGSKKTSSTQRALKDSWSTLVHHRRNNRRLSVFSKLGAQMPTSSRNSDVQISSSNSRGRNALFEAPVELMCRHFGDPLRRRRSLATSSSCSQPYHSVVVKDEINADISLRYQLDGPFLGLRSRRFSTVSGVAIRQQRRASLIPFGLIHNTSVPKMFCDDSLAHL